MVLKNHQIGAFYQHKKLDCLLTVNSFSLSPLTDVASALILRRMGNMPPPTRGDQVEPKALTRPGGGVPGILHLGLTVASSV